MPSAQALLRKLVAPYLPVRPPPEFAPIRTGKFNESYWVFSGDETFVLRIAPADATVLLFYERLMMRQEPEIHRLLLERTTVPVARIVAFDDSRSLIDQDYILMERLPGRPWIEAAHVSEEKVLYQTGEYLAQAHQIQAPFYGYLGAHRPMEPAHSWAEAFSIMWHNLISDIELTGIYDGSEAAWARKLLDRHLSLFEQQTGSCLLHMDVWHQNILVDEVGRVTGVVDWDRALWGDPEIEFAVLDYCGISKPAFWKGYGKERELSASAQVRQLFYLLYELQKYIVIRSGRNGDDAWARRYKAQAMDLLKRSGLN